MVAADIVATALVCTIVKTLVCDTVATKYKCCYSVCEQEEQCQGGFARSEGSRVGEGGFWYEVGLTKRSACEESRTKCTSSNRGCRNFFFIKA